MKLGIINEHEMLVDLDADGVNAGANGFSGENL
jgi:hypothetical protein